MKAKDTFLLNNTITQNPILARRAWFYHVASLYVGYCVRLGLRLVSKLTVDTSNFFMRSYIQSVIKISVNKIYLKKPEKVHFIFIFFPPLTLTLKS